MSASGIRQRKLFKTSNHSKLFKLLNDTNIDNKEIVYLRTQVSERRDSYTSRPTLQSTSSYSRQIAILQDQINKEENQTEKYFQEMESLESQKLQALNNVKQKYAFKIKLLQERIQKQDERNKNSAKQIDQMTQRLVQKLMETRSSLITQKMHKKGQINDDLPSIFLGMIKSEKIQRQFGQKSSQQIKEGYSEPNSADIQETLMLEIKSPEEERQSQSILLDNSFME